MLIKIETMPVVKVTLAKNKEIRHQNKLVGRWKRNEIDHAYYAEVKQPAGGWHFLHAKTKRELADKIAIDLE